VSRGPCGQSRQFVIAREPQCDRLLHPDSRVQRLAGQKVVAQVFLDANSAVLRLERKHAAEDRGEQQTPAQHEDQRRAVQADMVAPRLPEVHTRADAGQENHRQQHAMEDGVGSAVVSVALRGHGYMVTPAGLPPARACCKLNPMDRRTFLSVAAASPLAAAPAALPTYRVVTPFAPSAKPGMPGPYPGRAIRVRAETSIEPETAN